MSRPPKAITFLHIADFICTSFEANEQFPSLREIAKGIGLSVNAIYCRIARMETEGYIKRGRGGKIINVRRDLRHEWLMQIQNAKTSNN